MESTARASRRSSRRSDRSLPSAGNTAALAECGHEMAHVDLAADRDIKCGVCWMNREILVQRLLEPFEPFSVQDQYAAASAYPPPLLKTERVEVSNGWVERFEETKMADELKQSSTMHASTQPPVFSSQFGDAEGSSECIRVMTPPPTLRSRRQSRTASGSSSPIGLKQRRPKPLGPPLSPVLSKSSVESGSKGKRFGEIEAKKQTTLVSFFRPAAPRQTVKVEELDGKRKASRRAKSKPPKAVAEEGGWGGARVELVTREAVQRRSSRGRATAKVNYYESSDES